MRLLTFRTVRLILIIVALVIVSLGLNLPSAAGYGMTLSTPLAPQSINPPVIAYISAIDGNVFVTSLAVNPGPLALTADSKGEHIATGYNTSITYGGLHWSPDGNSLVFERFSSTSDGLQDDLFIENSGHAPQKIASIGKATGFATAWSPDGTEIGYVTLDAQGSDSATYQLQAVSRYGGKARVIGTFTASSFGEGGPLQDPDDGYFSGEQGKMGSTLVWWTNGIIHAQFALYNTGLTLNSFDGKEIWHLDDISETAISANESHAVGLQANGKVISVNLVTGNATPLTFDPPVTDITALAWSADNQLIYYSTATRIGRAAVNLDQPGADILFGAPAKGQPGVIGTNFKTSLWLTGDTGGQSTLLFTKDGRAILNIDSSPVSQLVAFSFLDASLPLVEAINAGKSATALKDSFPRLRVGTFVEGGKPILFDADSRGATISSSTQFSAIPVTAAG